MWDRLNERSFILQQPWISIIIPIYNVESYLKKTLESVIHQSKKDFELIVVDDGSKDSSLHVANEMLEKSNINFKIFSHSNRGVGYTRNFGIKQAQGKYVYFLDGDDIIESNTIEILINYIKKDFDIILFQYKYKDKISIMEKKFLNYSISGKEIIKLFCLNKVSINMCSFIVKKSILEKNMIFFTENVKYGEDHEFILKILFHITQGILISEVLFNYIHRESSAVNSFSADRLDSLESANRVIRYIAKYDDFNELSSYLSIYFLEKCQYNLFCIVKFSPEKKLKNLFFNQINDLSKKNINYSFLAEINLANNLKYFLNCLIIKYFMKCYYIFKYIKHCIKSFLFDRL